MIIQDGHKKLKINCYVLAYIKKFRQLEKEDPESGGILAGRENISNENLIIEHLTFPSEGDSQSRNRFLRRSTEHIDSFNRLYKASDGTIRYVGEWHTHPEDIPHYSPMDCKNWRKISKLCGINQTQYHIIAGRTAISVWKYGNGYKLPQRLGGVLWEEIND